MKKSLLYILGFGIFLLNLSCATKFSTSELRNNFSKEEIKDLQKITDFFKSQICKNKNSNFKTCFTEILPELIDNGWKPILIKVDFEKQKELYALISKSTFDEIWVFGKARYPETGLELKSIGSKYNGRYQKYIAEIGLNNKEIKDYADRLTSAGDFESMGLLQSRIYLNPTDFNLDNPNIQLIISIHYLSQNDNEKRVDKWE